MPYASILRYCPFFLLTNVANLAFEWLIFLLGESITSSTLVVGLGTMVGLVLRYFPDKWWIFERKNTDVKAHYGQFSHYTIIGIITSVINWSNELGFGFDGKMVR